MQSLDLLVDYATYQRLENSSFVIQEENQFQRTSNKRLRNDEAVVNLAREIFKEFNVEKKEREVNPKKALFDLAVKKVAEGWRLEAVQLSNSYFAFFYRGKIRALQANAAQIDTLRPTLEDNQVQYDEKTLEEALRLKFFSDFDTFVKRRPFTPGIFRRLFNTSVDQLLMNAERAMIQIISKSIIKSLARRDVSIEKKYEEIMTEFIKGGHLLFVEEDIAIGFTIIDQLTLTLGSLIKHGVESTHYKPSLQENSRTNARISGFPLLPENLFCKVKMAVSKRDHLEVTDENGRKVYFNKDEIINGMSYESVKQQFSSDEDIYSVDAIGIQTENFPDGPVSKFNILPPGRQVRNGEREGFKSYLNTLYEYFTQTLPHRIYDYCILYAPLKRQNSTHANVAKHVGLLGKGGLTDRHPIVLDISKVPNHVRM